MLVKKKKKKSILSLDGIAKGRKAGIGNEREYTKKKVSKRIANSLKRHCEAKPKQSQGSKKVPQSHCLF